MTQVQVCPPRARSALSAGVGTWRRRLGAALVAAACGSVLAVAARLDADPSGLGTHRRLGLAPCGFREALGVPCVTCGYTTAFCHAADGRLLTALRVQPAGMLLALATSAAAVAGVYGLLTGAPLLPLARGLWHPLTLWVAAAVVLGAWVYKVVLVCRPW